jgi:hypothetical protein
VILSAWPVPYTTIPVTLTICRVHRFYFIRKTGGEERGVRDTPSFVLFVVAIQPVPTRISFQLCTLHHECHYLVPCNIGDSSFGCLWYFCMIRQRPARLTTYSPRIPTTRTKLTSSMIMPTISFFSHSENTRVLYWKVCLGHAIEQLLSGGGGHAELNVSMATIHVRFNISFIDEKVCFMTLPQSLIASKTGFQSDSENRQTKHTGFCF